MHSLKEVLDKIDMLHGDIRSLRHLLVKNTPPLPSTYQLFLRLNQSQIKALVALHTLGIQTSHSASEVSKFLGVRRAVASKALNDLQRLGIVTKTRNHRTVMFQLLSA